MLLFPVFVIGACAGARFRDWPVLFTVLLIFLLLTTSHGISCVMVPVASNVLLYVFC